MIFKHLFARVCAVFLAFTAHATPPLEAPVIDQRVELLSIVFRLAECDEYASQKNTWYVKEIENHFHPYKNHELIRYVKKIRNRGIGFDAVMQMAIHIGNAPSFEQLLPFSETVPEIRWGKSRAEKFRKLLKQFYTDAQCEKFFREQRAYYQQVVEQFMPVYDSLDINWYTQFYGKEPEEKFRIILAPGNGGNNYGPLLDFGNGNKEIYAIMGVWEFGDDQLPRFTFNDFFPILLHEFNHSFVNPMLSAVKTELESSCSTLFTQMEVEMRNQAYGDWEVMFNESVVRAAVVQYMMDHQFTPEVIEEELSENYFKGFIWIYELVEQLNRYSANRNTYPTLEGFLSEIGNSLTIYVENLSAHVTKYNANRPIITSITEFSNGAVDVDAQITTITINFDQEMLGYGYSINYGEKGKKCYPEIKEINYSPDKRSVILSVNLQAKHDYQLVLLGKGFRSKRKVPIAPYEINFKTK